MNATDVLERLKHFRTTIAGVLLILGSLASFIGKWASDGLPNAEEWTILGTGLTAGAGLIASADAKVVKKQVTALNGAVGELAGALSEAEPPVKQ